jgi:excisionase family DNA binding protein
MIKHELKNEIARIAEQDEWLTAKELAPRLRMSPSTIYSLVRRGSSIPCAKVSKGKILFSWASVGKWLHELESKKRRNDFED